MSEILRAKWISKSSGRQGYCDRWECPRCRSEKRPECRMTLSKDKRGSVYPCRFCRIRLMLRK